MKKRFCALALCALLPLSGCSAMLERSYEAYQPHENTPITAEDDSYVRVENYQELVSAVLYLVSQGEEEGVIRLYDYTGEVEEDLSAACLEVAVEDPLGAYCVDYIKHEYTRVVSYYQATLSIRYRRTEEQVASMVNVTGTSAIRQKVREALTTFREEVVLRVAYFAEDEASVMQLVREAYYDTPAAALGMPEVRVSIYPDAGRERVLEIVLNYPEEAAELRRKSRALSVQAEAKAAPLQLLEGEEAALQAARTLRETAEYDPAGKPTAYAALVDGAANSEGLALAYMLLCREAGVSCELMEGTRQGEPWRWNSLQLTGAERLYLDPSGEEAVLRGAREMVELGYAWAGAPEPETLEETAEGELQSTPEP